MASVRFICGTQDIHKELEASSRLSRHEDTILYSSCFDANGGLFETLLGREDAIISDELNHASIIDGIRLCKAQRFRYKNNDMADLEEQLKQAAGARHRVIATDGVFSMDGIIANLPGICDLAEKYDALVMVDDSHAVGFMGENGRGTPEYRGVMGRIDIITGTLGKALGGASGGYISGRKEIVDLLAATFAALSIFQYHRAAGCRPLRSKRSSSAQRIDANCATSSKRTRGIFRAAIDRARFDDQARRSSYRSDHDW